MGQFGRITCRADLPSAAELRAIMRAVASRMDESANPPRGTKAPTAKAADCSNKSAPRVRGDSGAS